MIVTKTPLRISFVGGGSDRPSFYQEETGYCVAAAIDKYVYVAVNPKYDGSIRAAYSVTENVTSRDALQHELMREALRSVAIMDSIEIHSIADIPAGTGLGSSSSFTVGLLNALQPGATQERYAQDACQIEIDQCRKSIGKQDQYTAAYGGVNLLRFAAAGVTVEPIACDRDLLRRHCLLLDTGLIRHGDAGDVLAVQRQDRDDVRALAQLARDFARAIGKNDLVIGGAIMDEAWAIKRRFLGGATINEQYEQARQSGAYGGKLCGAGGGGFLLFLAPPERHRAIITALGLRHVPIRVGVAGSEVVYNDH